MVEKSIEITDNRDSVNITAIESKRNGTRTNGGGGGGRKGEGERERGKRGKKGQGFLNGNRKDTFEDCLDSTPIRVVTRKWHEEIKRPPD